MSRGYCPFVFYELRAFNNVLYNDRISEVIATRITENGYFVTTKPLYSEELNEEVPISQIEGIPLSPLMVQQLGVPMIGRKMVYEYAGFRVDGVGFKNTWQLIHHSEMGKCDTFIKELHYVHDLQNLILDLEHTIRRIPFHFYQYHQSHTEILVEET